MALSFTEKLRLQAEASDIQKEVKSGSLSYMQKIAKQADWRRAMDLIKGINPDGSAIEPPAPEVPETPEEPIIKDNGISIIDRYSAGEFKNVKYAEFRAAVIAVDAAGGSLLTLQNGAQQWLKENESLILQAAA
ncbi:MAG: hypothetical protein ACRC9V_01055 [Aeromonas sp.]